MKDLDTPIGNAELRISLNDIHTEIAETKGIAMEARDASNATNGKVAAVIRWQEQAKGGGKVAVAFIVLVILPLAGWVLYLQSTESERIKSQVNDQIKSAIYGELRSTFSNI